jgi:hypothetical protein
VTETIHCEWQALPTKQHLPGEDCDVPGTGPDGWGIYEEDESDGYFAWLHFEAEAKELVRQHNAAVRAANGEEE